MEVKRRTGAILARRSLRRAVMRVRGKGCLAEKRIQRCRLGYRRFVTCEARLERLRFDSTSTTSSMPAMSRLKMLKDRAHATSIHEKHRGPNNHTSGRCRSLRASRRLSRGCWRPSKEACAVTLGFQTTAKAGGRATYSEGMVEETSRDGPTTAERGRQHGYACTSVG
jgi:hypothetical protein